MIEPRQRTDVLNQQLQIDEKEKHAESEDFHFLNQKPRMTKYAAESETTRAPSLPFRTGPDATLFQLTGLPGTRSCQVVIPEGICTLGFDIHWCQQRFNFDIQTTADVT